MATHENVCPHAWIKDAIAYGRNRTDLSPVAQCNVAFSRICHNFTSNGTRSDAPSELEVWGYGFLFVLLVSLASIIGVLFLPLMKHDIYKKILMGMVGLGVGCLCGSSIFTLIPESFGFTPEEDYDKYLYKSCVIVAAIYAFFLTERVLKLFVDNRKRKKAAQKALQRSPDKDPGGRQFHDLHDVSAEKKHLHENGHAEAALSEDSFEEVQTCGTLHLHTKIPPEDVKTHAHEHEVDTKELKEHPIKTVAWMVITGDGIVDGLSIAAGFRESFMSGLSISVAVLCEELPHELGDLAILLNSGMSLKRALLYNFMSACTCFAGLIVGILATMGSSTDSNGLPDASTWIFAIAGGMFLYISLVDMLPEMTHAVEEASSQGMRQGLSMLVIQNIGMVTGFVLMFVLARFKQNMDFSADSPSEEPTAYF